MLKLIDTRLLSTTQRAYLGLLDHFGVLKGDLLALLLIVHVALSPISVAAIGFKLVCLTCCLHLSSLQRSQRFALVNATAEWLSGMPLLRLAMMALAIFHVVREPRVSVVAAQLVALGAAYLFCAKVRGRTDRSRRRSRFQTSMA
jgi:hypothetical protein